MVVRMLSWIVRLAFLLLLELLPTALLSAPGVHAQPAPSIAVAPSSAAPGETVTLTGSGWPAGATVVARLFEAGAVGGPGADLAVATADANGAFSVQGTVPLTLFGASGRGNLNVVPGSYTIVAGSGPDNMANTSFTVGAPRQGGLVWGEVFFDVNANGQLDSGDAPAVAEVALQNVKQDGQIVRVISDGRGRYVAPALAPGSYRLSTQSQFQSGTWVGSTSTSVADRQVTRLDLPLRPGAPETTPTPTPTAVPPSGLPKTGGFPLPLLVAALGGALTLAIGARLRLRSPR